MKKVLDVAQVAHTWAQQTQNEGRNSQGNFYFNGKTIYSYGSHFPIATIDGNKVLFTLRTYSNTTAKHIGMVRRAISHKEIIYCYEVPQTDYKGNINNYQSTHDKNLTHWKGNIKRLLAEIGNPKNRVLTTRLHDLQSNISQLETYCEYFKMKSIKDAELKALLKLAKNEDIINAAKEAKAVADKAAANKMKLAAKAYNSQYLPLWRAANDEALRELPTKVKELCHYYFNNATAFTRLRFNAEQHRVETSKGVQIPVEVAKRAYLTLNDCIEGKCNGLNIPVMGYTITETTKDALIAGCHTIPKEDVKYIANMLNW